MSTDSNFSKLGFDVATQPIDKRTTDPEIVALLRALFVEVGAMRTELRTHVADEKSVLANAFPGSDPEGHKKAHEAWIKKAEASAAFWEDMRKSASKWGILGVLGFIATSAWWYTVTVVAHK